MKRNVFRGKLLETGLLLLFFFLTFPALSTGQESIIRGTVVDSAHRPLGNVQITFLDVSRGTKFTLKTKKDGSFFKIGIPPSLYRVSLELDGYFPFETHLQVEMAREHNLNFTLEEIPPKVEDDPDFSEGVKHFEGANFEKAIESFKKTAERFPDSIEANYNLAISLMRLNRVDEATAILEKLVTLKPDIVDLYFALGECYFMKEEAANALATFNKAVELQPDNYKIFYNLGVIYYKNGKIEEAVSFFERTKALNPNFGSAYYQEGLAFIKKGDYQKAIENLEKFLTLEPQAREAAQIKAIIEELKKKLDKETAADIMNG